MLAILISWTIIFFILFSLGDMFVSFYNKLCKTKENYNSLDTFLLGMCLMVILIPASSLWLPSNHYILFALVIIAIGYWIYNHKRLKAHVQTAKASFSFLNTFQITVILLLIFTIIVFISFLSDSFDSDFYHHQNIRWNEEYSVIPGLGNIEDRFGFNSNYLLLSAIFSFRFLFGEAIYTLQSLLFALILCWTIINMIKSKYDLNRVIAMLFVLMIFMISNTLLDNTSTDIIPILCILYYIVKTTLSPNWILKQPLLAYLLPITLITFKLSTAIFCLISLVLILYLIVKKNNRIVFFLFVSSFLIISLWCIRNVIITGYLVYPLYAIDLFSFDWKMPSTILILQKTYIYDWAVLSFEKNIDYDIFLSQLNEYKIHAITKLANWIICIFILFSPITVIYSYIKKKDIHKIIYSIYFISILCTIFNLLYAPDFRFMYGYIYGCAFILSYMIISIIKRKPSFYRIGNIILLTFTLSFCFIAYKKSVLLFPYIYDHYKERLVSAMLHPISHPRSYEANREFDKHQMDELVIFITKENNGRTFDILPATNPTGIPFTPFDGNKIQSIKTIESRGYKIQDGFRTKAEYIDTLNNNIEEYKINYLKLFNEKYYKK